ncbi:MAG: DUF805 domain-containing protein [Defluviitaleaceae bacterium]|nr:DUF805 domain-containing protein [Defluviitaleaceae bacterium]
MTEFVNMWKNYVNFSDRTTVRGYWMAALFNFLAALILGIVAQLIGVPLISTLYALAVLLPGLAIAVRRLRDGGRRWTYLFINLIPIVGVILYIIALCKPSVEDNGVPVV